MSNFTHLPPQQLPFTKKNKTWRRKMLDWADSKTFFNHSLVRKSVIHKKINYDLINGIIHMRDLERIFNPDQVQATYISEKIPHYPIMNSKMNVLIGEESKRTFEYKVVVTNPTAITEIENQRKQEILGKVKELVEDPNMTDQQFNQEADKMHEFYNYEWQDLKEIEANCLLNHYIKEYNMKNIFNSGFNDAMIVGEEIYQCDIVGGEPVIQRLNPLKVRIFKSGYSNKIEDADIIIIEDYWSPGQIVDTFYDVLTTKDREYIESLPDHVGQSTYDSMDNIDERYGFVNGTMLGEEFETGFYFQPFELFSDGATTSLMPYDLAGNIRVLRMYWKSRRKIKKIKSYDPETGEEIFNFYPETYITDKDRGEEEQIFYINEAWEGTKIGEKIYVNIRPRIVQYNRLSNPSRCHFGIVGSIYNLNDEKPFSLVDMMKPYNYLYDVIHDRLNKTIARNWGKIIQLDLAKVPKGWEIDKWMYFAKINGIAVVDSFKEGDIGAATGKLSGALNNASSGVIDAEFGNGIQQMINLLEFIKLEMSEVAGITRQREGQISNRETVGGVERATLQSAHITEWLFLTHEDVKKRVLECFIETAKIAMKGRNKKFQYILPDYSVKSMNIDGDVFAEADYGLVVDNSQGSQQLAQKMESLAQAALQNQTLSFSTIMKLYSSCSLAEKQRLIERDEKNMQDRASEQAQQQQQQQQQQQELLLKQHEAELKLKEENNIRDNEAKVVVAQIQASAKMEDDGITEGENSSEAKERLLESMRQFDEKMKLERDRLAFDKAKHVADNKLKDEISRRQVRNSNKSVK